MTISTRGRCSGSEPRPARRVSARARLQRRIGLLLLGLGFGDGLFEILQREIELVGIELFRAPAELQALKLADQMAQTVILAGELVALGGKPRLLGALGIAFGPGRDQHRAQRGDVVRQRLGSRVHGPIGPRNQRLVASRARASQSAAAHPATLGRGTRGAYIRRQSSPSNRAASCAPDSRITPSLTGGHLNVPPSSRFQISTRPVPS